MANKFFSLDQISKKGIEALTRFPFVIFAALAATILAIIKVHIPYERYNETEFLDNIILILYSSISLFTVIAVWGEKRNFSRLLKLSLAGGGLLILIGYYFLLPGHFEPITYYRTLIITFALHCVIAYIPFIGKDFSNAFWQYNKQLFLRFLTSVLFTGVLYIGLSLALLAVDQLFSIEVNYKIYFDLWIILAGFFNTWFFFSGFPKKFTDLEEEQSYPAGLKIFTQYILLPIIFLYLVILYLYFAKIVIIWDWPVGWVSYMILSFSIVGIFSFLLLYPIQESADNKWIKLFARIFYISLFPLVALLFFAIFRRISEYGITENRYFVISLAVWLLFITIYLLVTNIKNIKIIPITLSVLSILTCFGPWGAFSVSLKSQLNRFGELLEKNNLLENGKVKKSEIQISFEENKEISSIVEYVTSTHSYKDFQPFFTENLDTIVNDSVRYYQTEEILSCIGLKYVSPWLTEEMADKNFYFSINQGEQQLVDVSDYDYFFKVEGYGSYVGDSVSADSLISFANIKNDSVSVKINYNPQKSDMQIAINDSIVHFNIKDFIKKLDASVDKYNIRPELMLLKTENSLNTFSVFFDNFNGYYSSKDSLNGTYYINYLKGFAFIKYKKL